MLVKDPRRLLETLIGHPRETEWLEFKQNQFSSETVGKYVSALANAAMLHDEPHAYLIFGVQDGTHEVVGTSVRLKGEAVGSEPFEVWLAKMLHPTINFEIVPFDYHGRHVEIVCIQPAYHSPVRFRSEAFVRVDSALKPLRMYSERERTLWNITSRFSFERGVAMAHLSVEQVFAEFEVAKFLARYGAAPMAQPAMIDRLVGMDLLNDNRQGGFDATNLLALCAAKDINRFPNLRSKTARVIHYTGTSNAVAKDDRSGRRGYGLSFTPLLRYIMDRVNHREEMVHGTRRTNYDIPEIAIREVLANALIHQDFTIGGAGPVVEIFSDRVKITNPGTSLVEPKRLIDAAPRSRNEGLASIMRGLKYYEGRGSGIDRAVAAIEKLASSPPLFQVVEDSFVATLYATKGFTAMSKEDRIRACYQHAALRFESGQTMSNQSLRDRFGLGPTQSSQVSVVISDAKDAGLIKPVDEAQANRVARYLPYWG